MGVRVGRRGVHALGDDRRARHLVRERLRADRVTEPDGISLFEAIDTQRSLRRFTDAPVPEGAIHRLLEAARKAPSPTNSQP
ncbi:MAG: nitroreductase family protein, partial [Actinomycetota bacterium]